MKHVYDSWGRIKSICYPDGEVVTYAYNAAGDLFSMEGQKGNEHFKYIDRVLYDKFGLKTETDYGNGTKAVCTYDALQRLAGLHSTTSSGEIMQELFYDYDPAGNVAGIVNAAPTLSNGLGETYQIDYAYDDLYRLVQSSGRWAVTGGYALDVSYGPNGRISNKSLEAGYLINGYSYFNRYSYDYTYLYGNNKPHYVNGSASRDFDWDANGNLLSYQDNVKRSAVRHCWDEENRLTFTRNEKENIFGYYVYDAGGERGCKMNGEVVSHNINGQWYYDPVPSMVTLYASPYLVADFRGYTKHYYAGTERVASKLGGGGLVSIDRPVGDVAAKHVAASDPYQQFWNRCAGMSKPCSTYLHQVLYAHSAILCPESDLYFYHGDHLGSASWITDARGDAIQHLQYLPFGETRVDQRTSYWNSRYSFSGKEKDEESGYSYFGARYYDSDLSIWLSVDPLSDKYPGLSPYVYCANNPIRLIDPDGRKLRFAKGSSSEFKAQFKEAIQHLKKNKVDGTAAKLERSRQTYYIQEVKTAKEVTADLNYDSGTGETKTTINWCPTCGVETTEGVILSPTTSLNHEFGHALLFDETVVNGDLQDAHNYAESIKEDPLNPYGNENEQTVITGIEQRTAKALGEIGEDGVTRTNHQGKSVTTSGPTSNQKMETPIE